MMALYMGYIRIDILLYSQCIPVLENVDMTSDSQYLMGMYWLNVHVVVHAGGCQVAGCLDGNFVLVYIRYTPTSHGDVADYFML